MTQDEPALATQPFESGAVIRAQGQVWEVDAYVSEAESDDGVAFYVVDAPDRGTFGHVVTASEAELVMTAADAAKRTIPTVAQIRRFLGKLCGEETEEFDVDEVAKDDEVTVELVGTTTDGLRFAARVRVVDVRRVDF